MEDGSSAAGMWEPRRKHGLSAIKRLLHIERSGDAETKQRVLWLCSHLDALSETSFVSNQARVPCVGIGDMQPLTTAEDEMKKETRNKDPIGLPFTCPCM